MDWKSCGPLVSSVARVVLLAAFCRFCFSQDAPAFRVQSKQVLVPVYVTDDNGKDITGLTTSDFHLFEDGKEQKISVRIQRLDIRSVTDSRGSATEIYSYYSPRARWTAPGSGELNEDIYLLAYIPPPSPKASCHQIDVRPTRRVGALYVALREYCNTDHSSSDTFSGTVLDRKMEQYSTSGSAGSIGLSLGVSFVYAGPDTARADIALEFPQGLQMETQDHQPVYGVQVLGLVYRKDGSVAARFSDKEECIPITWAAAHELVVRLEASLCQRDSPDRYEIQLDMPPGDYELRTVVSNGKRFGMATMPLNVEKFDGKQLAISGITLSKRFHSNPDLHQNRQLDRKPEANFIFPTRMVPLVSKGIEFSPAVDTRFRKYEPMAAYFEVYEPLLASQSAPKVQVHLRIVQATSGAITADFQPVDVASYIEPGSSTIRISRKVPIEKLANGAYRLEVQALDSTGGTTAWRSTDFTVN